ncbi:MAG: hypothetical protein P4L69_24235, partial [Desulfosporosinus sp.]|nr:hypothetical protein [Desulfosporosinus sp.]
MIWIWIAITSTRSVTVHHLHVVIRFIVIMNIAAQHDYGDYEYSLSACLATCLGFWGFGVLGFWGFG